MGRNVKKSNKNIAFIAVFAILMPLLLQLIHSFEEHNHTVCNSKKTYHFHKKLLNCEILQFQLNTFNPLPCFEYNTFFVVHFHKNTFIGKSQNPKNLYYSKKSSRAPPFFIV